LNKQDWVDFKALRDLRRPFKKATVDTCSEKYPTLSLIVPWYNKLLGHIKKTQVTLKCACKGESLGMGKDAHFKYKHKRQQFATSKNEE
jgi:hypothetical protein